MTIEIVSEINSTLKNYLSIIRIGRKMSSANLLGAIDQKILGKYTIIHEVKICMKLIR